MAYRKITQKNQDIRESPSRQELSTTQKGSGAREWMRHQTMPNLKELSVVGNCEHKRSGKCDRLIQWTIMSPGTAAARALSLDIPLARLAGFCIPRTLCQIFRKEATVQKVEFQCRQIVYIRDIAEGKHQIPISINVLARAFNCPRSRVQPALAHGLEMAEERARQLVLHQAREQQILDWIQQNAEQNMPVSRAEIKDYCTSHFQVPITRGWVNSGIRPILTILAKREVLAKNSSVCMYPECS
jgi:hypothetical protein